jgi:pimeloyl-ACP methyl ester carboxylesterase
MVLFDYRGSGISEGDYTSMGVNESEDLERVIQYLGTVEQVIEFSLWGRSMGAVTILYYLTKQYYANHKTGTLVTSVVLDSPFSNMRKLMYEIGANNVGLPEFVFLPVVNSITEQLIAKMGFNLISELDLVARVRQIREKYGEWEKVIARVNCLFLTST